MPISQERMIALTNAALDYQQALETFRNFILSTANKVQSGVVTPLDALNQIITLSNPQQLLASAQSITIIALESRHWHKNAKRNIAERNRQRKRKGSPLKQDEIAYSAPHSLAHTPQSQAPANLLRQSAMGKGNADYIQGAPPPQVPPTPAKAFNAGQTLSPEAKAAIEAQVAREAAAPPHAASAVAEGLDLEEAVAEDQDDPQGIG